VVGWDTLMMSASGDRRHPFDGHLAHRDHFDQPAGVGDRYPPHGPRPYLHHGLVRVVVDADVGDIVANLAVGVGRHDQPAMGRRVFAD